MTAARPKVIRKSGKKNLGRGFSVEELRKADLNLREAVKLHIPVDPRRKTAHQENVDTLKASVTEKNTAVKAQKSKRKTKS